jgi:hypothetical protein
VSFDEYHQGFGDGASLWGAAWGWLRRQPGGWTILQLAAAGLVALALTAVRFGPTLLVVQRRRRSPLEHVDALAAGLQRAGAADVARDRLVRGLRRRLVLARSAAPPSWNAAAWLQSLVAAPGTREARQPLERLVTLMRERRRGDVRDAALAVEDAWEAMGAEGKPGKS